MLLAPIPKSSRFVGAFTNAGHLVLGALVTWAFYTLFRRRRVRRLPAAIGAWLLGFLLLGVMEAIQGLVGRGPSWHDVAANGLGCALTLVWLLGMRGNGARAKMWTGCMAGMILLAGLARPILHGIDALRQQHSFPLLASFEDPLELSRWRTTENCVIARDTRHVTRGANALRVDLRPGPWPGITFASPPRDFRRETYNALVFDIFVDGSKPLSLTLKAADLAHNESYEDAFHRTSTLNPGANTVRITLEDMRRGPKARTLNLTRMMSIQMFVESLNEPRTFFMDHVRLE